MEYSLNSGKKRKFSTIDETFNDVVRACSDTSNKDSSDTLNKYSSTACRSTDDKQSEIYVPESTKTENMEVAESLPKSSSAIPLQNKFMNWISCNATSQPTHNKSTIPLVFKQLCFYHFTSKCTRKIYYCNRKHYVTPKIGCRIKNLQFDQLSDAYTYAKERYKLYQETVLDFFEAFEKKNDAPQLIRCVGDILSNNMFDKTPFVEKILFHLCRIGTSFSDAVNKIFEEYNSKNAYISDILLDIICCRCKQDIFTNWHLVQKLTKNRVEPMDHILVEKLVKMCCEFDSVNLAKYIVQDIIKPLAVDFEKVNSDLLKHFLLVLQSHNLEQEKRLVLNKIDTCRNNQSSKSPISAENVDENNQTNTLSDDINYSKFNSEAKRSNSQSNRLKDASDLTTLNLEDIVSEDSFATDESSTASSTIEHFNSSDKDIVNVMTSPEKFDQNENNQTNTLSDDISYSKFNSEAKHSNSQSNGLKDASDLTTLNLEDIVSEDSFATDESSTASSTIEHFNSSDKDIVNVMTSPEKFDLPQNHNEMETEGSNSHLDSYDSVMLSEADSLNLKNVIQEGNKVNFLLLLLPFKNDSVGRQRQFVLNTLMCLKDKTPAEVYSMVFQVLTSIGIMARDYMKDVGLKNILTMLSINIIGLLENSKLYKEASNILLKFNENLESLMDTTWFTNCHRYEYSEGGKFIYFCKIFTKGDHFKEAWKVLTMPKYNLIYGVNKWKLGHKDPFDNVFRNYVLEDVICVSLSTDTPFAKMVLLRILQDKDLIVEIDIWKHCNQLLLTLLDNSENYIEDLRDLLENIMKGWYKNLSKEVMRGLLVCLLPEISLSDALKLYNICCEQDYYPCVKGDEKTLSLNPDMFPEEIHMTLHAYFYKKATNNFPLRDLVLFINLPNALVHQSKPSSSCNEMIHSMKTKISSVLEFSLPYTITMNCVEQESQHVLLKENDLERCYSHYQKMYSCQNVQ